MQLTNDRIQTMEPAMLVSIVNMKLRNEYRSLDELVRAFDLDGELLQQTLARQGYAYLAAVNQVRRD